MGLTNIRLGDYIERSTKNNKDLKYGSDLIAGVSSQGVFTIPKTAKKTFINTNDKSCKQKISGKRIRYDN